MDLIAQINSNGHLPGPARLQFDDAIKGLAGKKVRISVRRYQKQRSLPQNRYYFSVIVEGLTKMFREAGNDFDEEDTHQYLKEHVGKLRRAAVMPDGSVQWITRSTKELTTVEMEEYLAKCRAFGAQNGWPLPEPNEELPETLPDTFSDNTKEQEQ